MNSREICIKLERVQSEGASLDEVLDQALRLLCEAHPQIRWAGIYELTPDRLLHLGPSFGPVAGHSAVKELDREQDPARIAIPIDFGPEVFGEIEIDHETNPTAEQVRLDAQSVAACLARTYGLRRSLCR